MLTEAMFRKAIEALESAEVPTEDRKCLAYCEHHKGVHELNSASPLYCFRTLRAAISKLP